MVGLEDVIGPISLPALLLAHAFPVSPAPRLLACSHDIPKTSQGRGVAKRPERSERLGVEGAPQAEGINVFITVCRARPHKRDVPDLGAVPRTHELEARLP